MKKKNKKTSATKKPKDETKEDATKEDATKEDATEATATTSAEPAAAADDTPEPVDADEKAVDDEKHDDLSPAATPSLAQQSKLRSTSFRAGAAGPPPSPGPFSPDGDTAPDIYRKHVARIEELEKENKRLLKDSADADKRWKKAEEELADLREAEGDAAGKVDGDAEKLVRTLSISGGSLGNLHYTNYGYRRARSHHFSDRTRSCNSRYHVEAMDIVLQCPWHRPRQIYKRNSTPNRQRLSRWKLRSPS